MTDSNKPDPHFNSSPAIDLAGDEIHVWSASLVQPENVVANLTELLSDDEKARANRFYFAKDRAHFIVGRGLLRKFLGNYLGLDPAWVAFDYGPFGKPALKAGEITHTLQFNLSHSNGLALYAFGWNRALGIDVEYVRAMANEDDFAAQIFSASESALIASLAGDQKRRAFFKIWTCKEAFFKASGDGLTRPIDQAEIAIDAEENARLVSIAGDRKQALGWRLKTFQPGINYQAALAFQGNQAKIRYREIERYLA